MQNCQRIVFREVTDAHTASHYLFDDFEIDDDDWQVSEVYGEWL